MATAIFRVSGIKTTSDLRGIGKHNLDRKSETNMDIDRSRSHENITLKNCIGNYSETFGYITKDLKKQHEEQMKTTRKSRQKTFLEKIDDDKADVACEFLMSATPEYFYGMSHEEIERWGQTSLEFITDQIGIDRENILHAVVHMDEKTPHLHVVAVPLVEKYDGRRKQNVLAISRKHFIKSREDMSEVQTKYVQHLNENGFNLERGIEKSGAKHLDVARYKIQETQKELTTTERELLKKKNELKDVDELMEQSTEILETKEKPLPFTKKEIETEVIPKLIGKPEIIERETGNYVLTPNLYKNIEKQINAAIAIRKDYERLKSTDLFKENESLKSDNEFILKEFKYELAKKRKLEQENIELRSENSTLKENIKDLKLEMSVIYQSTKEFIEERSNSVKAFLSNFRVLIDKVKDKSSRLRERFDLEPKTSEFEKVHRVELNRERDRGLER